LKKAAVCCDCFDLPRVGGEKMISGFDEFLSPVGGGCKEFLVLGF